MKKNKILFEFSCALPRAVIHILRLFLIFDLYLSLEEKNIFLVIISLIGIFLATSLLEDRYNKRDDY